MTALPAPAMQELLLAGGLPALFLLSLLASTILPLGSEWLLVALLMAGKPAFACVTAASVGNALGALTLWWMGRYGAGWFDRRQRAGHRPGGRRARDWFRRYGAWSLLLSWLPLIGDGLCLAGGASRLPWPRFLVLVATGKTLRYLFVAAVTRQLL